MLHMLEAAACVPFILAPAWNIRVQRVGGITFLRIGQFGFSFYRTRKPFHA